MIEIGTLVTDTDIDEDIGLVVGHLKSKADGIMCNKVKWLTGRFVGEIDYIETECLEVIA